MNINSIIVLIRVIGILVILYSLNYMDKKEYRLLNMLITVFVIIDIKYRYVMFICKF